MIDWRIYYDDGSTFDSRQGGPEEAPARGVIAVNFYSHPHEQSFTMEKGDYYWWAPEGRWYPGDIGGLFDYLGQPGWKKVLQGRSIADNEYQGVIDSAKTDRDFFA